MANLWATVQSGFSRISVIAKVKRFGLRPRPTTLAVVIGMMAAVNLLYGRIFQDEGLATTEMKMRVQEQFSNVQGTMLGVLSLLVFMAYYRYLRAFLWLALPGLSRLAVVAATLFVVSIIYGCFSEMGMPGLFWHHQWRVQFGAAFGAMLFCFWMLYLLIVGDTHANPPETERSFWHRYKKRWPDDPSHAGLFNADAPDAESHSQLGASFAAFGPPIVFLMILPSVFPILGPWYDPESTNNPLLAWPWLLGVTLGGLCIAAIVRSRDLSRLNKGMSSLLRRPFWRMGRSTRLAGWADDRTNIRNAILLILVFHGLSFLDPTPDLANLDVVFPAAVSICVLLGALASILMSLSMAPAVWKRVATYSVLLLLLLKGTVDYEVELRDLKGDYPSIRQQYGRWMRSAVFGKGKPYDRVVDLSDFQKCEFRSSSNDKAKREECLTAWADRFAKGHRKKPILVVVCTSGGALRAALWTEVVLEKLSKELPGFRDQVRLITGASGGMLGASRFVVSQCTNRPMPALTTDEPPDYLGAVARRLAFRDILPNALVPFATMNRGDVLEDAFIKQDQGARDGIRRNFASLEPFERDGRAASIIFSPMLVEDGRRLLISNLPLGDLTRYDEGPLLFEKSANLLEILDKRRAQDGLKPEAGRDEQSLEYPSAASTPAIEFFRLFGSAAKSRLRLSSAVRMSATFPYVTPPVVLPTHPQRHVVDAGYYDNYGVNLAANLIAVHSDWIVANTSGVLVVQIRAFRNEKFLKLYDPTQSQGADASVGSTPSPIHAVLALAPTLASTVQSGLRDWFIPLQGVAEARNKSMYFRNDEQLRVLHELFKKESPDPRFFKTVIFTCDSSHPGESNRSSETLNWYMSKREFESIKKNMDAFDKTNNDGRDRNFVRTREVDAWWKTR